MADQGLLPSGQHIWLAGGEQLEGKGLLYGNQRPLIVLLLPEAPSELVQANRRSQASPACRAGFAQRGRIIDFLGKERPLNDLQREGLHGGCGLQGVAKSVLAYQAGS